MKISVHLECDTPEEFERALSVFRVSHLTATTHADKEFEEANAPLYVPRDAPEGYWTDDAIARKADGEPEPLVVEPVEEPPVKKARKPRGPNKPKAAPVEPVITPPVGPAPVIEAPVQPKAETASRQDLLDVFSEYVQRYGVSFGYTDISTLLQQTLGDGIRKASDVPDESLGEAVSAIRTAINDNPYNRKRDYA